MSGTARRSAGGPAGRSTPSGGDGRRRPRTGSPRRGARCGAGAARSGRRMSTAERPWTGRRLHFVGVGGAGMSGYARAAHALGAELSGSDAAHGPYLERLALDGVLQALVPHSAENLPTGEGVEVVYSSAVP